MKHDHAVATLSALAQDSRLEIFRRLIAAGREGLSAGELSARLKVAAPTLSFHLKSLEHAKLVVQHREGRSIIYSANFATMRGLLEFLMADCCGGRPEICDIDFKACCA